MDTLKIIATFIILNISCIINAQNQANIWYFGYQAGIDFNTPQPTLLQNQYISNNSIAGTAICDTQGTLLFYLSSKYKKLYNASHQVLKNSFFSFIPATVVIVPFPNSQDLYYVIAKESKISTRTNTSGNVDSLVHRLQKIQPLENLQHMPLRDYTLSYMVVDMRLNQGKGGIKQPRTVLDSNSLGKGLGIIRHQNRRDYWLVNFIPHSKQVKAYLINAQGLQKQAIISSLGPYKRGKNRKTWALGNIKSTIQGDKVLFHDQYGIYLANFNNQTGLFEDSLTRIYKINPNDYPGGGEFSPDGTKLYFIDAGKSNAWNTEVNLMLAQYDLEAGNEKQVNASLQYIQVFRGENVDYIQSLQLAPDGKIYGVGLYDEIVCIHKPNLRGDACAFEFNYLNLGEERNAGDLPYVTHLLPLSLAQKNGFEIQTNTPQHLYIEFASGKSEITSKYWNILDQYVTYLKANTQAKVEIVGHTDNVGTTSQNQVLSAKRAEAVALYLRQKGIDKSRIKFEGKGSQEPLMSNQTRAGRTKNRRIEMRILD